MKFEERIAAQLVESALTGAKMTFVVSQAHNECDFRLTISGKTYPLEVTTFTNANTRRQHARIAGRDGDGHFIPRTLAQKDWYVTPSHASDPRDIRERIDAHLAAIEEEGLDRFDVTMDTNESPAVRALWLDLRVTDGTVCEWTPSGQIGIAFPPDGAMLASDQINAAIEREAAKEDNVRKLSDASAEERHFFVYFDWHGYPAQASMRNGLIPTSFPNIPSQITHVWAATSSGTEGEHLLWCANRSTGWHDLGAFATS
jgi:hypothetical protein